MNVDFLKNGTLKTKIARNLHRINIYSCFMPSPPITSAI